MQKLETVPNTVVRTYHASTRSIPQQSCDTITNPHFSDRETDVQIHRKWQDWDSSIQTQDL